MLNLVNKSITQTPLVGGSQGSRFDDVETVSKWPAENLINVAHPIQKLEIRHGWVVDAINVTYQLTNGSTKVVNHGAQAGGNNTVVNLSADEIVLSIQGKAGPHAYYKNSLVNQVTVVIFNTKTTTTRIAGPYGNGDNTNQGEVFCALRPIALAGFQTTGAQTGMSGISFFKANAF